VKTLEEIKATLSGASMTLHFWRPEKACRKEERHAAAVALEADDRRIKARKEVIDTSHPAWRAAVKARTAARAWWDFSTFPCLVPGQRYFLRSRREELWAAAAEHGAALAKDGADLDACREELVAEARASLGRTFDPAAYPISWEAEFSVELREHAIDPPSYLAFTNAEEYQRELQRSLRDIEAGMRRFEQDCFRQMGEASARLLGNLQDGARIMGGNVESFRRLFSRVAQMQFEGTQVFRSALAEAQDVLDGVEPDDLRRSAGLRAETRERLEALIGRYQQLQGVVLAKGKAGVEATPAPEPVPA
jgi:hypothetical protein